MDKQSCLGGPHLEASGGRCNRTCTCAAGSCSISCSILLLSQVPACATDILFMCATYNMHKTCHMGTPFIQPFCIPHLGSCPTGSSRMLQPSLRPSASASEAAEPVRAAAPCCKAEDVWAEEGAAFSNCSATRQLSAVELAVACSSWLAAAAAASDQFWMSCSHQAQDQHGTKRSTRGKCASLLDQDPSASMLELQPHIDSFSLSAINEHLTQ